MPGYQLKLGFEPSYTGKNPRVHHARHMGRRVSVLSQPCSPPAHFGGSYGSTLSMSERMPRSWGENWLW